MKIWMYSGGRASESCHILSAQEGFKRMIKGKFVKNDDVVVNWGTTAVFPLAGPKVLNDPMCVRKAVNKFHTFTALTNAQVSIVPWTANQAVAKEWQAEGHTIVARTVLTGHEGAGIIIVEKDEDIVLAPLYTKYIFKTKEYRVHATRLKALATHQKIRDPKQEPKSWKIRSYKNGFIFQRNNIAQNDKRDALAVQAVAALGLDFGAVDIIEDKKGNFYVLEVNTAPGIEGQTTGIYSTALKELAVNA